MKRKLPSMTALAAFEAAARHQSYTRAADDLALTQSAVCRQIASLETSLGLKLFRRSSRGVALTEAGERYAATVRQRLNELERDTLAVIAEGPVGGTINLGVVPTFAAKCLIPKLADFQSQHPSITLNFHARPRPFLLADSGLDAAIHPCTTPWPGTQGLALAREVLVAVASPRLVGTGPLPIQALTELPLLQMLTRPYAWRAWFESLGMTSANDLAGSRFELYSLLTDAACAGLGVALIPRVLIQRELSHGELRLVTEHSYTSPLHYYFMHPTELGATRTMQTLRAWLASLDIDRLK